MNGAKGQPLSVFLAHDRRDKPLADLVAKTLKDAGLRVRSDGRMPGGDRGQSAVRDALRESDAYVLLASNENISSPWTPFEMGAVMALERPIFVIKVNADPLPPYLASLRVLTPSQLPELVRALQGVRRSAAPARAPRGRSPARSRQPA